MAITITRSSFTPSDTTGVASVGGVSTYTSINIGTASADRIVVLGAVAEAVSATVTAATIDYGTGDIAMIAGTSSLFTAQSARLFYQSAPTGTTATFKITYGAAVTGGAGGTNNICTYAVTGATGLNPIPGQDTSTDMDVTDPLTTGAVTILGGGGFIGIACCGTDTVAKTWANATEDLDVDGGAMRLTTATRTTSGSVTITCTGGTNNEDGAFSWLIFIPEIDARFDGAGAISEFVTQPVMESIVPDADSSTGSWLNELVSTPLYSSIDEASASNTDYIYSSSASSDVCKISLSNPSTGALTSPAFVSYRYQKEGTSTANLQVRLLQSTTQIASWSHSGISESLVTAQQGLSGAEIAAVSDWNDLFLEFTSTISDVDAATTAWVAAVITNGGSVSDARKAIVDALIVGLKADGIFSKLDRLWLLAAENEPSAKTDIIATSLATEVGALTFAVDDGYSGFGSTQYLDTDFNPTTAPSPKFTQNSAMIGAWSNTNSARSNDFIIGITSGFNTQMDPREGDGTGYFDVNSSSAFGTSVAVANSQGWFTADRNAASGAGCLIAYKNGSSIVSGSSASAAIVNADITIGIANASLQSNREISAAAIGEHLTGAEHTALYDRLRTYMTAVGVP